MVMEGLQEDMGDGTMQCMDHPYKNNTPGGICAFCLQEKLGKLVSSSFPVAVFPSSSHSSSPGSRSDVAPPPVVAVAHSSAQNNPTKNCHCQQYYSNRSRLAFLLTQRKKKKTDAPAQTGVVFKRSMSTATPRCHPLFSEVDDNNPQKRRFWSFLYHSKRPLKNISSYPVTSTTNGGTAIQKKRDAFMVVEENGSPEPAPLDRKVSRSRSVGCGSRSFSGDFFDRISTGFGDCTLRRVESQREGKSKVSAVHRRGHDVIKERVKCGGLFIGFMIASSSSSTSSSSSSSTEDNVNKKPAPPSEVVPPGRQLSHGRSKSWGWALASPMRAFTKHSVKRQASNKNSTPNLAAIPSLLSVNG